MENRKRKGFTLIEVLVVIMILGMMASIVVPRVMGRAEQAKVEKAKIQMQALANALETFKFDNGFYPSTTQGLEALIKKPTKGRIPQSWPTGGYLTSINLPLDPWLNPFAYMSPGKNGQEYDLICWGMDGVPGGKGNDADVSLWEIR